MTKKEEYFNMENRYERWRFLKGFFELFEIPQDKQKELREAFAEILSSDFMVAFLKELPEEKKQSFLSLVNSGKIDKESIDNWFKENNITLSKESSEKLDQTVKDSLSKFFSCFTQNLNEQQKQKLT